MQPSSVLDRQSLEVTTTMAESFYVPQAIA